MNDDNAVISWGAAGDAELSGMLVREGGTAYFVGAMADMESNGTMKVGVWNHMTITYDGKLLRIYINGKLDKEDPPGLQWDPKKARKLNTVLNTGTIGILSVGGEAPFDVGLIDEVSVYGKALSADEVKRNYTQPGGLAVNSAGKTALTWGAIKASN